MDIIICGAGQVGQSIACQLSREDNSVTIIDKNESLISEINDTLDVRAICGMASHPSVLERAGAKHCDMIIAVTYSDEVNMIACQIARSLFDIPTKVARVRHPDYLMPQWKDLYRQNHLPIDVTISPEQEVANAIIRRLHAPGALDSVPFSHGDLTMLAIKCNQQAALNGLPVKIVRERLHKHNIALLGINQNNKFRILDKGNFVLTDNDIVYVLADRRTTDKAMSLFGHKEKEARRIVILGGGNIGLSIAQNIERDDSHVKVKLIELSPERAQYVVSLLNRTTVINGSGLDAEILSECDIDLTETMVCVTNDDKANILSSLLAKNMGCKRTMTLVNNASYIPMLENLGIDVLVNPRETTVSSILQHIRRGQVSAVHSIMDGEAEIIEVRISKASGLLGKVVGHLNLPRQVHLGAILRNHALILPSDEDILHEGDSVVMVSLADSVKQLEQFFSNKTQYF